METESQRASNIEVGFNPRHLPVPATIAILVTCFATIAGLAVGPGTNSFINVALRYSAQGASFFGNLGSLLPLGFAFAAGMVATVNPCGFVILPAFLTMYLTDQQGDANIQDSVFREILRSLSKAIYVSAALGAGFVLLFGVTGLAISAGAQTVVNIFPWIGFLLGFVMAGLGAYLFAGGTMYNYKAQAAASTIGNVSDTSIKGYFLFGISYAIASLSCTLPIFIGLISSSLARGGILQATSQFLAYALGMTFVITILTIGIAMSKSANGTQIRRIMPYVSPISAGILIVIGGYLIFYWLTEGELGRNFGIN